MSIQLSRFYKIWTPGLIIACSFFPLWADGFYDQDVIGTIELKFDNDNWDAALDALYEQDSDGDGDYDRLLCTVIINGIQYENAGIRYKGNSTYKATNTKNPFNIKLDHLIDQDYEGYGTLKLSNVFKDPSFVRETLSYEIARKYMDAPQANYMKIYVYSYSTGQYKYLGLYTNVESVDKKFTSEHFFSKNNARFKCNPSDTWAPNSGSTGASLQYLGSSPSLYSNSYILESNDANDWQDLIDLTYDINYNVSNFDNAVDLDRAIWMLVFDNVLVNLDSYIGPSRQNFYLYQGNDNRWITTLWDLNECFGSFSMITSGGRPSNSTDLIRLSPTLRSGDSGWPLLKIILANSTYKKMYIAHMKTILEENFSNGWYKTRALAIQGVIKDAVYADINKFYTYDDFTNNISFTRQTVIGIAELMDSRVSYLNTQSVFLTSAPVITNVTVSSDTPETNSSVWINAKASNATSVALAYRQSTTGKFQKIPMSDNGNSHDGAAGDGTYGASLSVANADIQYYIYAENSSAAIFSPERAEYDYYTIDVAPASIVINEFMAENNTTIQDPDGGVGYPDWIELYNSGPTTVNLGGMYLTDDLSKPDQWQIPAGVTIEPGEHLLFWADNDEDQGNFHTNFKLSAKGESIGLFDLDANGNQLIDSIAFGAQAPDISYGRVGDGTDNWRAIACPSPGSANPPAADLDGNCVVNLSDLAVLGLNWLGTNCNQCGGADLTGDGKVDLADLMTLSTGWMKGI